MNFNEINKFGESFNYHLINGVICKFYYSMTSLNFRSFHDFSFKIFEFKLANNYIEDSLVFVVGKHS